MLAPQTLAVEEDPLLAQLAGDAELVATRELGGGFGAQQMVEAARGHGFGSVDH
jgi:hypothetical protein